MNEIWNSELHPYSKLIAACLRSHMHNNKNNAHPSYGTMARRTGLSKSSLAKYMTVLEKGGWIKRIKGNSNTSTKYYISLPTVKVKELSEQLKEAAESEESDSVLLGSPSDGIGEEGETYAATRNRVLRDTEQGIAPHGTGYAVTRTLKSKEETIKKQIKKQRRFSPPSIDDVKKYLDEKEITSFTAEEFHSHYDTVNWYRGKTKIKNWKSCVTTWVARNKKKKGTNYEKSNTNGRKLSAVEQVQRATGVTLDDYR